MRGPLKRFLRGYSSRRQVIQAGFLRSQREMGRRLVGVGLGRRPVRFTRLLCGGPGTTGLGAFGLATSPAFEIGGGDLSCPTPEVCGYLLAEMFLPPV